MKKGGVLKEVDYVIEQLQKAASTRGVKQVGIVERSGLSRSTVARSLTRGKTPTLENLFKLCKGLNIKVGEVLPSSHLPKQLIGASYANEPQGTYITKDTHARLRLKLKRLERQIEFMEQELDHQENEIIQLRKKLNESK